MQDDPKRLVQQYYQIFSVIDDMMKHFEEAIEVIESLKKKGDTEGAKKELEKLRKDMGSIKIGHHK